MAPGQKDLAKERLTNTLESTLFPSLNSRELQKNSLADFQYRFMTKFDNIAELYHENSKLNKYLIKHLLTDEEIIKSVKNWYLSTTHKVKELDIDQERGKDILKSIKTLPGDLVKNFIDFSKESPEADLLYSVDLFLLHKHKIYRYIPLSEFLWFEKKVDSTDIKTLKTAIIREEKDSLDKTLGIIFLIGCPWRNMVFYGPRGYRNMLIDAGYLIHHLLQIGQDNKMNSIVFQNFHDREIDQFLDLDGVEKFTLAIIAILDKKGKEGTK